MLHNNPEFPPSTPKWKLGIDIGRVIIGADTDNPNKSIIGPDFLKTPEIPGAVDTISFLHKSMKWEEIHLVSKCGPRIQNRSVEWLIHNNFFERTGLKSKNMHFCLERKDKAGIVRDTGITHFIDDRIDVLDYMIEDIVGGILLVAKHDSEPKRIRKNKITIVKDWAQIPRILESYVDEY